MNDRIQKKKFFFQTKILYLSTSINQFQIYIYIYENQTNSG